MASCCIYCLKSHPHNTGNAPPFPDCVNPTMYDHMEIFRKYRQIEKNKEKIHHTKIKMLRLNSKFVHYDNIKKDDEFSENSTFHSLYKFKQKIQDLNGGNDEIENKKNDFESNESLKQSNFGKKKLLSHISRHPIKCLVSSCEKTIGVTSIFGHFIRDHRQEIPVDFNEIENEQRSVLSVYASNFQLNEIVCLGVLAYGGKSPNERPASVGICTKNVLLPQKYLHLSHHLPIIAFGYKTTICDLLKNRKLGSKLYHFCTEDDEIYVIWLSTVETTERIFCTMTAFDQNRYASLSTTHEVRNLLSLEKPSVFLSNSSNYLWLSSGDINNLSNYGENSIELEIYIGIYDQ